MVFGRTCQMVGRQVRPPLTCCEFERGGRSTIEMTAGQRTALEAQTIAAEDLCVRV